MSDNKYIIDKDSLTGIADAVRDKLGAGGEATIDETTGEIVYPEGKGYYLKENPVAKFNMGNRSISAGHYSAADATFLTVGSASDSTEYNVYFQKPFYSVTLSFVHVGTTGRTHYLSVNGVSQYINASATKKFTFSTPQSYLIIKSSVSSAYGYDTITYQDLTVTLFDEAENIIEVKTTSIKSYNFLTELVPAKIPYSIDDIQDKITNYLGPSSKSEFPIDYEGLSYSYVTGSGYFMGYGTNNSTCLILIPLTSGQKIGFCIGETVSNRLRASFFSGKTYDDFSRYVTQPVGSSTTTIYSNGIGITGGAELSGDSLLKRFYYTAPADGELVVGTSSESKLAFLHVWEVTE